MLIEELSEDINLYLNMIPTLALKEEYIQMILFILHHANKHSFKSFAYLLI